MLDVLELEKKWSRYHFKKMLPRYIITVTLLVASAIGGYLFILPSMTPTSTASVQTVMKKESSVPKNLDIPSEKKAPTPSDSYTYSVQNILTPSLTFTANLDKQLVSYNNALILAAVAQEKIANKTSKPKKKKIYKKPKKYIKKPVKQKTVAKKRVKPAKKISPPVKKKQTKITTQNKSSSKSIVLGNKNTIKAKKEPQHAILQKKKTTDSELASVIKRFKRNKKPALGLFIANKYYVSGNYKSSYKYAKATYKINPNIEDAVLLYAKSLAKLGHKDKAIAKLKPYIKKSGSIEAKALLNNLNKGLFK